MKKSLVIILASLACIMLIAAGCTSSSGSIPATTPAASTAAPMPSAPAAAATTAIAPSASAPVAQPWSGSWNTTYTSVDHEPVLEVLTMTQAGSSVTGTYGKTGTGAINATVQGSRIAGTWSESDNTGTYSGLFEFEQAADQKSFTGKWASTTDGAGALKNTTQTWNGVRV